MTWAFVAYLISCVLPGSAGTKWRLPVTIEAVQDVAVRGIQISHQSRGVLYVGRGKAFTIKKGERFQMIKIEGEGACRIEFRSKRYDASSCPWLDGFRDHQQDFFRIVTER